MNQRSNIGYVITDSICIGDTEYVIGKHETDPNRYVTWECRNGTDYFWGHYLSNRKAAEKDLIDRAHRAIEFREHFGQKSRKGKER